MTATESTDASNRKPAKRDRNPRGSGERLRTDILDAATELLLEEDSVDAVSIRAVARKVGVTSPSIYMHFVDKEALLEAVCTRYFEQLSGVLEEASAGTEHPIEALAEQGLAYVRFAVQTPELYRLATMNIGHEQSTTDLVLQSSAFTQFADKVTAAIKIGYYPEGDVLPLVLQLWAAAHGVAALMIAKPYLPWGDDFALAHSVLRAVCLGQPVADLLGGDPTPAEAARWVVEQRAAAAHETTGDEPKER